jgi:alkanesulfonate monooxygenase SsuD/methylene tetrahydromethanopterin reductase-like flavin-dependent oxidoreductase (luciferase family)
MDRMRIAWTSPETLPIAANAGLGMLMTNQKSWDDYSADVAAFNSIRAGNGLEPTQPTVVVRMTCAETEEEAWEAMKVHSLEAGESSKLHYQFDDPERFANTKGYEQYAKLSNAITDQETLAEKSARPQAYGTPDQVFDKLREIQGKTSAEEFVLNVRFGAMPIEQAERSLRLFAAEVLPRLHELDAPLAAEMRGAADGDGHASFDDAEQPTRLGL